MHDNIRICGECADDPPINYILCRYACGTRNVIPLNSGFLGRICRKCFTDKRTMTDVCKSTCGQHEGKSRLCWLCYDYGLLNKLQNDVFKERN